MRRVVHDIVLCVLFLAAEIGWLWFAIDHHAGFAVGVAVYVAIAVLFGRAIGAPAFAVPLAPLVVAFAAWALGGFHGDDAGEDPAWVAVVVWSAAIGLAEVGVLVGYAWRQLATERKSATVSANARSVASGS